LQAAPRGAICLGGARGPRVMGRPVRRGNTDPHGPTRTNTDTKARSSASLHAVAAWVLGRLSHPPPAPRRMLQAFRLRPISFVFVRVRPCAVRVGSWAATALLLAGGLTACGRATPPPPPAPAPAAQPVPPSQPAEADRLLGRVRVV